ncbi:4-Cys prefix domain-containing protein [Nostoc sp.]
MSLCINPNCQNSDNPDNLLHCQSCYIHRPIYIN